MKVVHICQSADANLGGSLTVARALVRAQRDLGVDARLVCLYLHDGAASDLQHPHYEILCQVKRRSRWSRGIYILRRELNRINPDVIHHHDGILWPRLATMGMRCPRFTHGHLGRPRAGILSPSYWVHQYMAKDTDCLVAISSWVAESWLAGGFPSRKIRLIPNGVDQERFYPRPVEVRRKARMDLRLPMDARLLLWAGRLDRETKGLDRLVAVAKLLPADMRLVIAGDGPAREWLAAELEVMEMNRRPMLLGKIEDPAELFGISDAFLFTSKVEPFGLVLLEAASSGLPIFAFDCDGGGRELLRQLQATVIRDGEEAALIQSLAADQAPIDAAMIEELHRKYSWAAVAQATLDAYAEFRTTDKSLE